MPRKLYVVIAWAVIVAVYRFAFWVGSLFGAFAGFVALGAISMAGSWFMTKFPPPERTQAEWAADKEEWAGFLNKLFWPVGPFLLLVWVIYTWFGDM